MGGFEAANAAVGGAGEGAFFVAEEFGFDEGGGHGGAVHGDEGIVAAAAGVLVDGFGDAFLAGAGFAEDEDGGEGVGGAADEFEDALASAGSCR